MVCGTLIYINFVLTVLDQNPLLFELLTGTIQNQGCKERAEKIELLMNFDAELIFKVYKIHHIFSILLWYSLLGFQNVVIFRKPSIKMWSSLGGQ